MKHASRRVLPLSLCLTAALLCALTVRAFAAEIHAPATVVAGQGFSMSVDGSGQATFYLLGPDHVVKRNVNLGGDLQVNSSDVKAAGRYQVIVCSDSCASTTFEVRAAPPAKVSFFLHPSRVPVSSRGAIDAVAFVFDQYFDLVLSPVAVDFTVKPAAGAPVLRRTPTLNGVASIRLDSTSHEGPVHVTAEIGEIKEARVVQQVAAEACGLRLKAAERGNVVAIETDPVRDCSGNPLPDGTVVSFTKVDQAGRSTVDVPIKKGLAQMQFKLAGPARISIACGVVVGNEIAVHGAS